MKVVTAYKIADAVNNNAFHTVKYPDDYFWVRMSEVEKLIQAARISVLAMFAYQGPPSKHWLDTQGKYYEGWNDAIDHILELLKKKEV
jgi:hypothetical protein